MSKLPKITFGIIVLNGEPFTRYCLRSLYPFAHEIIVVEGAVPGAKNISTPEGHSRDGTLESVREFIQNEDPEKKVQLITAESLGATNGFWSGEKDQMSAAYADRATGEYLWQVDIDEFYRSEDVFKLCTLLSERRSVSAVYFKMLTFWGGFDYLVDGPFLREGAGFYLRLFRWGKGYRYTSHRPPTVVDESGVPLTSKEVITGKETASRGIFLYHYSLLFPKQVREKCEYYAQAEWSKRSGASKWAQDAYTDLKTPFHVHNVYQYVSWLERFSGQHPVEIEKLREDISRKVVPIEVRPTDDIERLLRSGKYKAGRAILRGSDFVRRGISVLRRVVR